MPSGSAEIKPVIPLAPIPRPQQAESSAAAASRRNAVSPTRYKKRGYGHSCHACRVRKIKCEDGENPPCKACREANTVCEQVPSKRAKKPREFDPAIIDDFERRLRRLEGLAHIPRSPGMSPSPGPMALPQDFEAPGSAFRPPSDLPGLPVSSLPGMSNLPGLPSMRDFEASGGSGNGNGNTSGQSHQGQDAELGRPQYHLGTAKRPVYHGELSMFEDQGPSAAASPTHEEASPQVWSEERLRAAARLRHRYADPEDGEAWLDAYFSWASPVYAVVHRPTFLRDMALGGPYFSEFLLIVIYCTGIRLTYSMDEAERTQKGEHYVNLAMNMLADQVMGPGRICTVQALLGLSGRQCALGRTNQAWMLAGMAIRMMQDMGLHLAVGDESRFSKEDRDMRRRIYWSAYCWDKTLALTLGREPSLLLRPGLTPDIIPEDPDDDLEWSPALPPGKELPMGQYPKQKLLKSFCLRHFAALNIQLESIIANMYSPGSAHARSHQYLTMAIERLETWRRQLPPELKLESGNLPLFSPPTNIMITNMLYHAIRILIYRPLLTANNRSGPSSALNHCRSAAIGIHELLSLWGRTFGHTCLHYLLLYCCFLSACVDIILIRTGSAFIRAEALQRVHLCLEILETASMQGPGIKRGIRSIHSQLNRASDDFQAQQQQHHSRRREREYHRHDHPSGPNTSSSIGLDTPAGPATGQTQISDSSSIILPSPQDVHGIWFDGGEVWDNTNLLQILGPAPLNTEDPFSFALDSLESSNTFSLY